MSNTLVPHTLIVGAGPGGLSMAGVLTERGLPFTLLDRAPHVGQAWRDHYDRLHLHTPKPYSHLPGYAWPDSAPRYPSRLQVVQYLEDYAQHFKLKPLLSHDVVAARHDAASGQWQVDVKGPDGHARTLQGDALVVATGTNGTPVRPEWPGMAQFKGQLLHSSEYGNGQAFKGQRVLVVGLGNSGGEICIDLHEHGAKPTVVIRNAVNIIPRDVLGVSYLTTALRQQHWPAWLADAVNAPVARLAIGDLRRYGVRKPPMGPTRQVRETGRVPLIDIGTVALIKSGALAVRPGIDSFTESGVRFADGREEPFDAVVLATGFRPQVAHWLQTPHGTLDANGLPITSGDDSGAPGLYYIGFRVARTGMFREIAIEAPRIADRIAAQSLRVAVT